MVVGKRIIATGSVCNVIRADGSIRSTSRLAEVTTDSKRGWIRRRSGVSWNRIEVELLDSMGENKKFGIA